MTKEELIQSRERFQYLTEIEYNSSDFNSHFEKYDFFSTNSPSVAGQYFVYQLFQDLRFNPLKNDTYHRLTYPKLGVYINALPCDQTIEVEWVDYRRTCENNLIYDYQHEGSEYSSFLAYNPTEIKRLPLWHDSMLIYGLWNSKPNWRQIRQAYERTWWFHKTSQELRNIQLNRLLK